MDESEEPSCEFIVASSDPSETFELLKETLNEMSLLVLPPVAWPRLLCVYLGWDAVLGASLINELTDGLRPICFVRHDDGTLYRNMQQNIRGDR